MSCSSHRLSLQVLPATPDRASSTISNASLASQLLSFEMPPRKKAAATAAPSEPAPGVELKSYYLPKSTSKSLLLLDSIATRTSRVCQARSLTRSSRAVSKLAKSAVSTLEARKSCPSTGRAANARADRSARSSSCQRASLCRRRSLKRYSRAQSCSSTISLRCEWLLRHAKPVASADSPDLSPLNATPRVRRAAEPMTSPLRRDRRRSPPLTSKKQRSNSDGMRPSCFARTSSPS